MILTKNGVTWPLQKTVSRDPYKERYYVTLTKNGITWSLQRTVLRDPYKERYHVILTKGEESEMPRLTEGVCVVMWVDGVLELVEWEYRLTDAGSEEGVCRVATEDRIGRTRSSERVSWTAEVIIVINRDSRY